jgi:hypothetical protein
MPSSEVGWEKLSRSQQSSLPLRRRVRVLPKMCLCLDLQEGRNLLCPCPHELEDVC